MAPYNFGRRKRLSRILDQTVDLPPIERSTSSAQFVQDAACGVLLTMAMVFACYDVSVISTKELKNMNNRYIKKARRLQNEALIMRSHRFEEEDARKLEDVAQVYLKRAQWYVPDQSELLIVKRKRGDGTVRGYLLRLAETSKELFGKQLSGCLAIMTNVVFGTEFSWQTYSRNDAGHFAVWCLGSNSIARKPQSARQTCGVHITSPSQSARIARKRLGDQCQTCPRRIQTRCSRANRQRPPLQKPAFLSARKRSQPRRQEVAALHFAISVRGLFTAGAIR